MHVMSFDVVVMSFDVVVMSPRTTSFFFLLVFLLGPKLAREGIQELVVWHPFEWMKSTNEEPKL